MKTSSSPEFYWLSGPTRRLSPVENYWVVAARQDAEREARLIAAELMSPDEQGFAAMVEHLQEYPMCNHYLAQIPFLVSDGTEDYPCLIGVTEYNWQAGNSNPNDYHGEEEISFEILHQDGSEWVEMDLTRDEVRDAEQKIRAYFQ